MEEIQKLALKVKTNFSYTFFLIVSLFLVNCIFQNESGCFPLGQTAKSGEIEMKFKIISEGLEVAKC